MKQEVTKFIVIPGTWKYTLRERDLNGRGNIELLSRPLTAFFASRVCPTSVIRAGLAWALDQIQTGTVVIGGFHSPLERSVLNLLLEARAPTIVVLAREVKSAARLALGWRAAIEQGHLAIVSEVVDRGRLNRDRSAARNELVAWVADRIVVAYTSTGGSLEVQVERWRRRSTCVRVLGSELVRPAIQ
jgi:predicted Rossmann fold nucleotide-binding protein DprA/Smf involved in DNA uptake